MHSHGGCGIAWTDPGRRPIFQLCGLWRRASGLSGPCWCRGTGRRWHVQSSVCFELALNRSNVQVYAIFRKATWCHMHFAQGPPHGLLEHGGILSWGYLAVFHPALTGNIPGMVCQGQGEGLSRDLPPLSTGRSGLLARPRAAWHHLSLANPVHGREDMDAAPCCSPKVPCLERRSRQPSCPGHGKYAR